MRTGLKLVEAVRAVNVFPRVHLDLRVGIASGPVAVDLPSGAFEGMAIKKAERLKTVAEAGQVIVSEDTKRLVRNFFEYADLGVVQLKGFEQGAHAWRVVRESAVFSRFEAQRAQDAKTELVGRADALAQLASLWASALTGHGSAVCLVGDAGMGKSRLARAALEQPARDGTVVEIDCTPSTGNSPLLPIGVLLRRTARIAPDASEAEKQALAKSLLKQLLGEEDAQEALEFLAPLFGIQSMPVPLDKTREQVRTRTITTIVALVRALAAQRPLAILCEDLHWADDTTAQVVQSVARAIGDLPAVLIVTQWPKAVTPIDLDDITEHFVIIPVEPLAASNAADLVRAVGGGQLSADRIHDIVDRCGGVPLLLEEVTRSVLDPATPRPEGRAVASADSSVPPELQLIVESRIGRWPHLRGLIEAAAVLGREFPIPLLQAMVADRAADVPEALTLFAEHGLFAPAGGSDRASFRHALIRDAVYETVVSRDYLRNLHSNAADALIAHYLGTPDATPDVLAQHLRLAERLNEAIRVRLSAAEETFGRGAYVEATGHCDAAHNLIEEVGDKAGVKPDAFRLCVLRGMVGTGMHGYSAELAEVAYRAAQSMFDESTSAELRYPVIRGLATASLVRGDLATAYRYSHDALSLAEQSNRPDYRIDAMSVVAYTTLYFDRLEDCRSWIARCLSLYEAEHGDTFRYPVPQDAKTAALALLPTAAWLLGDVRGAEEAIDHGLQHVENLGRDFDKALLHAWIAGTRYTQRRYELALRHAATAYALGKEHNFQEWEGVGAMMSLLSQSALQPSPEAVAQAIAAGQMLKEKGIGLNASYFLWGIARGLLTAGNPADASAMLSVALQAAAASRETRMNPEIFILQAEIERDDGKAAALLTDAYALAESQGAAANALRAAANLAMRVGSDAESGWGRSTLNLLDGRTHPGADRPEWMREELARGSDIVRTQAPRAGASDQSGQSR